MARWVVETVNAVATAEVEALPAEMRTRLARYVDIIEAHGIHALRFPHVDQIEGKLWELRLSGRDGIARALYTTASGRRVVILHTFMKKRQKTPRAALRTALARAKEAGLP